MTGIYPSNSIPADTSSSRAPHMISQRWNCPFLLPHDERDKYKVGISNDRHPSKLPVTNKMLNVFCIPSQILTVQAKFLLYLTSKLTHNGHLPIKSISADTSSSRAPHMISQCWNCPFLLPRDDRDRYKVEAFFIM